MCACFKFGDEKTVRTVSIKSVKEEKAALEKLRAWYTEADVIVTWYGKMFDVPFINSRLLHHRLEPLPPKMHKDLKFESSSKFRFRGNRLENVSKDLKSKYRKYDVEAAQWILAAEGDPGAIAKIVKHCQVDVKMTEEMLGLMKPLILNITR